MFSIRLPKILWRADGRILYRKTNSSSMEYYVKEFVISDIEAKYGKMDPTINPDIYDAIELNIYDDDDGWDPDDGIERISIDTEIDYQIKNEVSIFWDERFKHYTQIIRRKGL